VLSVIALDRVKIDDPVGAVSVHLVCGVWGTLAVGIFSTNPDHTFFRQLTGVGAYGAFVAVCALVLFYGLKLTVGLRVSEEEERDGLDYAEHEMHSYEVGLGTASAAPTPARAAE
jgi:Amt family ammonium transporter